VGAAWPDRSGTIHTASRSLVAPVKRMASLHTPLVLACPDGFGDVGSGSASITVNVALVPARILSCSRFEPIVTVAVVPSPLIAIWDARLA
jgi:hypothetical protein